MPNRAPAPQRFVSHDGEEISFFTHGSPNRSAVFLLHGFTNSALCWFEEASRKRFASGLALDLEKAGYYVVAPDLRGHGQSAKPGEASKYTKEQELYDVVALANHLNVEKFAIVGYSHGAIEAAKLLTIDELASRVTCGVLGGIGDKLADKGWSKPIELALDYEEKARSNKAGGAQRLLALAGVQRGQSCTTPAELARIRVPVLCINGRNDLGDGDRQALSGMIPGSELAWLKGDHATAPMEPEFCERIVSFISASFPAGVASAGAAHDIAGSQLAKEQPKSYAQVASQPKARRWKKEKTDGDKSHVVTPLPESHAGNEGFNDKCEQGGKGDGWGAKGKGKQGAGNLSMVRPSFEDKAPLRCSMLSQENVKGKGEKGKGNDQAPLSMDKTSFDKQAPSRCSMASEENAKGKGGKGKGNAKTPLRCQMMSQKEVAAITVPFEDIEARLSSVLARHGAAVVTGVASDADCVELESMFADDLQELIDREALANASDAVTAVADTVARDPRALPAASMKGLGNMNRCQLRGLPHGRFAWAARLNPRVRRAYEVLHGTTELVSSCDNSFFAPGSSPEERSNRNWPHVDHNKHDHSVVDEDGTPISDWEVYQGILYVWPSTDSRSSTTVVWTGSHTGVYEEMMSVPSVTEKGRKGHHFTQFPAECASLMPQWHAAARRVPVPAGALFLWSSRTVHQGWTGGPRLAQPVCWEPRNRRTEAARVRKLRMAALGLPSTHWGSLGLPHMLVTPCLQPKVKAERSGEDVTLPMISTLRPVTLADGVQVQQVWQQLAAADWYKRLPKPLMEMLERSIAAEFHDVL